VRFAAIRCVAEELDIAIPPELVVQIDSTESTPHVGYPFTKELIARKQPFTALFAFNDVSAFGAIWALREAGIRVPHDVSVVGFDDVPAGAFSEPALTTVRQPLHRMGYMAAQTLIDQIEEKTEYVPEIAIEPELVVRASTAIASSTWAAGEVLT
jgi:DNA-binding LacI/PurR family transcriptional regulator